MPKDIYPSTNMHSIEALVFSNHTFSLEVLMREDESPSHFVTIALTTHEVMMAIAIWENCFGFMIRPQMPKTHASFQKYAPGSWTGTMQGSKQNLLKLLHTTGFDIIRFSALDLSQDNVFSQDTFFDYSIRVPMSRVAARIDVFLKDFKTVSSEVQYGSLSANQFSGEMSSITSISINHCQNGENMSLQIHKRENEPASQMTLKSSNSIDSKHTSTTQLEIQYKNDIKGFSNNPIRTSSKYSTDPLCANEKLLAVENLSEVTETIRLPKYEVSAIIGPQGKRIRMIGNSTHCRLSVLPSTLETMNSRFRSSDFPQVISLTGKPQQVTQAKIMLRRALLEHRSK